MRVTDHTRWQPVQSPLRVEFPSDLLSALSILPHLDTHGPLYGIRRQEDIQILPRLADTENLDRVQVGTFAYRVRGEVFLTEDDLERFEKQRADVALVIAGNRAGFFVREPDGSVQGIRSYQEFPVESIPVEGVRPESSWMARTLGGVTIAALLLGVPLAGWGYLQPGPPAIQMRLKDAPGQLLISWDPRASTAGGRLEITDGQRHTVVALEPNQSSATYAFSGGRVSGAGVEVQLTAKIGPSGEHIEMARYLAAVQLSDPLDEAALLHIRSLEESARELQSSLEEKEMDLAKLDRNIKKLLGP